MINLEINQEQLAEDQQIDETRLKNAAKTVGKTLSLEEDVWVSFAFVGANTIRSLNRQYRGKDKVTDVLSFPLSEEKGRGGEVVVCLKQAERQAKQQNHSIEDEVVFLLVHGILHILGYDHETDEDAKEMFPLQAKILRSLGVNPKL